MSCHPHTGSPAAFAARRWFSWRALFDGVIDSVRACRRRRRQRQELLDYLASDHRAVADIGMTAYDARAWSARPFWRP